MITLAESYSKGITIAVLFIIGIVGAYYISNPILVDRLILSSLMVSGLYCLKNKDVLGALIIVFGGQLIYELVTSLHSGGFLWDAACYSLALFSVWKAYIDKLRIPTFILLILCISAEMFWHFNDYDGPSLSWYWVTISTCLLQRHLLIMRCHYTITFLKKNARPTLLDHSLKTYCIIPIIIEHLNITEYLARHVLDINSLFVYQIYPWLQQFAAIILVITIILFAYKAEKIRVMEA